MRALVAGWFSFQYMGATAGDLLSRDVVCGWLDDAEIPYDVAAAPPFAGVDWQAGDPSRYTHLVFVCGPLGNGEPFTDMARRFSHCRAIGVNLSMLAPVSDWNPFDLLLERDSDRAARPDLSLLAADERVPVVGVVLVHEQREYDATRHVRAHEAIAGLLERSGVARVAVDTVLDVENAGGLRTPAEIASVIGKMDAVVTTRLHGGVLALKAGVPVLWIDPVVGGAKIARQAESLGWPAVFTADALDDDALDRALAWCLTDEARRSAREATARGTAELADARAVFLAELHGATV